MFTGPNIVRDGLVLAYDSANVRSYPGVSTTLYDMSGNGNHGTKINSPTIENDFTSGGQLNYTLVDWSGGHPTNEAGLDAVFNQGTPATGTHSTSLAWGNAGQAIRWGGNVSGYPSYHNKTVYYGWKVEGYIYMPETGTYSFQIDGDDAIDFFIGGHKCAYWYGGHGFGSGGTGTSRFYHRGWYPFVARMEEQGGGDGIAVAWNKPSDSGLSTIPIEYCATSVPNTRKNRRIDFDGTDDHIDIANDVLPTNSPYTLTGWIRPNGTNWGNNSFPLYNTYPGNGNSGVWHHFGTDNVLRWRHGGPNYTTGNLSGIGLVANTWQMSTITWNGSTLRLFKNDNLQNSVTLTNGYVNVGSKGGRIGMLNYRRTSADYNWNGDIATNSVYTKALTPDEVVRLYNATKGRFL